MLTDVLSSAIFTTTGQLTTCDATPVPLTDRLRIKAIYYSASVTGTVTIRDGSATGPIRMTIATTASASGLCLLPGEGILCTKGAYAVVTGTLNGATMFYG